MLALVNTDLAVVKTNRSSLLTPKIRSRRRVTLGISDFKSDLLGQPLPKNLRSDSKIIFTMAPGATYCLASSEKPAGRSGEGYRNARARAAFAMQALNRILPDDQFCGFDWTFLAGQIAKSPQNFLAAASRLTGGESQNGLAVLIEKAARAEIYPNVITWTMIDARRVTPVPANHWLVIEDSAPFRATLTLRGADGKSETAVPAARSIAAGENTSHF